MELFNDGDRHFGTLSQGSETLIFLHLFTLLFGRDIYALTQLTQLTSESHVYKALWWALCHLLFHNIIYLLEALWSKPIQYIQDHQHLRLQGISFHWRYSQKMPWSSSHASRYNYTLSGGYMKRRCTAECSFWRWNNESLKLHHPLINLRGNFIYLLCYCPKIYLTT